MNYKILIGILIGFTVVFLLQGAIRQKFEWSWWIGMLIGGLIGHIVTYNFWSERSS